MKKAFALLLASALLFCGCSKVTVIDSQPSSSVSSNSVSETSDSSVSESTAETTVETTAETTAETTEADNGYRDLSDPDLLDYIEDTAYEELVSEIDNDKYVVQNVEAIYISEEYLEELEYNSKQNIFFGYTLDEIDAQFKDERYVFTLGDEGETVVKPFESYDDTTEKVIRNVAIGTGVILVCVVITVVTDGVVTGVVTGEALGTTDIMITWEQQEIDGITYVDGIMIVNKTYSIPASYIAPNSEGYEYCASCLTSETMTAFNNMQADAQALGLNLYISSGYRSYSYQENLYNNYVYQDGKEAADTYSARPGHSEHQTGLAFDLNTIDDSFAYTDEGKWVAQNCYKYGLILRYPEGKEKQTGYKYESWHLRYVGTELAEKLYNNGNWITLEENFELTSVYE